ncbi:hypothetical protein BDV96DRAFT_310010 [Lophiotrema nucula]|uniref:Uncharacterized protein n=1 Tax=Lophiotrema nucula TaxID=690887 RepID=A0A6A5YIV9_9PLEO|nr:hypothetical protein BDV96DRAFT_310010 [Lophiotrema nucula]
MMTDDALKRAQLLIKNGFQDVFVAKITPSALRPVNLTIHFDNEAVQLPVWQTKEKDTFIPTSSIRRHLRVNHAISQLSEWFAVEDIPRSMITMIYR